MYKKPYRKGQTERAVKIFEWITRQNIKCWSKTMVGETKGPLLKAYFVISTKCQKFLFLRKEKRSSSPLYLPLQYTRSMFWNPDSISEPTGRTENHSDNRGAVQTGLSKITSWVGILVRFLSSQEPDWTGPIPGMTGFWPVFFFRFTSG